MAEDAEAALAVGEGDRRVGDQGRGMCRVALGVRAGRAIDVVDRGAVAEQRRDGRRRLLDRGRRRAVDPVAGVAVARGEAVAVGVVGHCLARGGFRCGGALRAGAVRTGTGRIRTASADACARAAKAASSKPVAASRT